MRKRIALVALFVSVLLVIPELWMYLNDPVLLSDTAAAFTILAHGSLQDLSPNGSVEFTVTTPSGAKWNRVVRHWGDPGYLITAVVPQAGSKLLHCFDDLELEVKASSGTNRIALERATHPPYMYSNRCQATGMKFVAPPGTDVEIRVTAKGTAKLPIGDLIVISYWGGDVKDRLVGVSLNEMTQDAFAVLAGIGGLTFLCAASILLIELRRFRSGAR